MKNLGMLAILFSGSLVVIVSNVQAEYLLSDTYQTVGAATATVAGICPNCTLTVGNIGSSGDDGVQFDVRQSGLQTISTFMDWEWWDPNGTTLPLGATLQSDIFGTIGGVQDQRIATFRMEKSATATYDATVDFSPVGQSGMQINVVRPDGTPVGQISNPPPNASVVMRVDPGLLDQDKPYQLGWIVGPGTDSAGPGGIPLPPGGEVFCGLLYECEYHGWPALAEVGVRVGGNMVQSISADPNETTGILAIAGDGSMPSNVDEITTFRLTFANVPEFQVRAIQLAVVPEPGGSFLFLAGSIMAILSFPSRRG
jgi:hypothetical protein